VEVIAHSCGVPHPRRLKRFHVRMVCPDGVSRSLSELYPTNDPADSSATAARNRAITAKAGRRVTKAALAAGPT
jgi:hypothetical protein